MRLGDMTEGSIFRTKFTGRTGTISAHTKERGVVVQWDDTTSTYVHPDCEVEHTGDVRG